MNISTDELLSLNHQGIIPGPEESEEAFLERAAYCLRLQKLCEGQQELFTGCENASESSGWLTEAHPTTLRLFDIEPTWLPVVFSNYHLYPWHGGCAWIFQIKDDSPTGAIIQLRRNFRANKRHFLLYDREELLSHEICHVGRMMFNESNFEEILAFRTSPNRFRRWFGPILQSTWESLTLICMLFVVFIIDLLQLITPGISLFYLSLATKALPLFMLIYLFFRLSLQHFTFSRCLDKLRGICRDDRCADATIYRLTDKEIKLFARSDEEAIENYADEQKQNSLRWSLIKQAYF